MAAAVVAAAHERLNRRRRQRPHRRRWSGGSELGAEIVASMLFMLFMQAVRRSRVQEPLEDPRVARAPQTKRLQTIPLGVSFFSIQLSLAGKPRCRWSPLLSSALSSRKTVRVAPAHDVRVRCWSRAASRSSRPVRRTTQSLFCLDLKWGLSL